MKPKGIIFQKEKSEKSSEVILSLSKIERIAYRLLRGIGAGLIGFAVLGFIFSYGPPLKQEISYRFNKDSFVYKKSAFADLIQIAEAEKTIRVQNEAKTYGIDSHFSIFIPKINAGSNIIANVDASNEGEYSEALSQGVAHAKGTYFPGQGKNIYLFSHSTDSPLNITRYNAVFYLLGKLEEGDLIIVFFADKKYEFQVERKLVTSADDVSWLNQTQAEEILILQTCDPPGTTWRRLLVIAKPVH
ncbi:hypothetical protein A2Z22_02620 [Candidatus Woesebacteria bacterium RBG_16_34_12]|uniref:Sortase n=1 Tax=Candidatus Woesebacteria bacterium RBG_16_34_12 TaxID=1802480 RepID=A0A1F7X8W0_9BACT|nr:MAG: hypothetical protein A2Z22_02620 [Candidatus Woesebacteria bacterium RBG_16_34_12]